MAKKNSKSQVRQKPTALEKAKYIKSQPSKMLSAYGGVGSILETPQGAMMVEEFDKWKFFESKEFEKDKYLIEDERLLKRLKRHFQNLEKFIRVPTKVEKYINQYDSEPDNSDQIASAKYFPEWVYCPRCERFKHIKDWWDNWSNISEKQNFRDKFIKPKCYHCYEKAIAKNEKKKYYELEQVRFIMTAPDGEIKDLPWDRWNQVERSEKKEEANGENIRISCKEKCCKEQDMRYSTTKSFTDLAGIRIKCVNPKCDLKGREVTLVGLFGYKDQQLKTVIRTSISVYYPLCYNSIYLPKINQEIEQDDNEIISQLSKRLEVIDKILQDHEKQFFDDFGCEVEDLDYESDFESELETDMNYVFESENEYRLKEYNFILENPNYKEEEESKGNKSNLTYENQNADSLSFFGISSLIKVKRLKLTTVQTGYTRQEPFDKDLFLKGIGDEETTIEIRYTSSQKAETPHLLATESFGEGIFIALDEEKVDKWFEIHECGTPAFMERIKNLEGRIEPHKFESNRHLAKFVLVHTLSHILIKELEFLCGYSAASLNERLFVDSENMQGVLLYTVAGSEGSYGGLITQSNPDSFKKILESALFRSRDCASDPVCYHSDGQGIGGKNLAACYSCALLPETSCEEYNSFLDRALLIDKEFGFIGSE